MWSRILPLVCPFLLVFATSCVRYVRPMQPNIAFGGRAIAIAVKPADSTHIVVASETGGLFLSTNRGVDWQQVSGATTFWYSDVAYVPGQPNTIVATANADMRTVSGGGIWRSTNGGIGWSRASLTPPTPDCTNNLAAYAVAAEAGASRLWAGTLCGLVSSTDSGATWQYLAPGTGYSNDKTYAVLAPGGNQLKILTDAGVKVSTDGGTSWTVSLSGLPSNIIIGAQNQIALSPFNSSHLYWAFNYWLWVGHWEGHAALFRSTDNGSTWSSVLDTATLNRPPFVRVTGATGSNTYELYYADGGCTFERAQVTNGSVPTIGSWTGLNNQHCDHADVAFDSDSHTPLLLVGDGGLQLTSDEGANWTMAGGAGHGYAALQITEVTGQGTGSGANLYFATQDNDIWASPDDGTTWPNNRCCEGFFLNVSPASEPPSNTKFTGVSCSGCGNFISGPVLAGQGGFPNPPNDNGNPRLVKPANYIQNTKVTGVTDNIFDLTTDTGGSWAPRYGFPEDVRDLSKIAGDSSDPTVFTAVRESGSTSDGQEIVGIKRISGVTSSGTPVLSDITSFGSLGIFPTMFAWYKPFGVNPGAPDSFIVPDIVDNAVKESNDGGATWSPDATLTSLITESGSLKFRSGPFTEVSSFGYDDACPGHIMIGTVQAGIFQSYDNGSTWSKVQGSEIIPLVSSFYFHRPGQAVVSSYGRGLWTADYKCKRIPPPPIIVAAEPLIWWKGAKIPISQIHDPDACPVCTWAFLDTGTIVEYAVNERTGQIQEVRISGGTIKEFSWQGTEVPLSFHYTTEGQLGGFSGEKQLAEILRSGKLQARGLLVEKDLLKGVILWSQPLTAQQIPPATEKRAPKITVDVPRSGTNGIPAGASPNLVVHGRSFASGGAIEVLLDGRPVEPQEKALVNDRGEFTFTVNAPLNIGGHTILVRQKTAQGVIQDAYTFHVTVSDTPRK